MKLSLGKLWMVGLAAVLVWWGLMLFDVLEFGSAEEILAIGAFVTAFFLIIDK